MIENKQKYSTSTVLIVILFLAIFIIIPPFTRVFYKEEEPIVDEGSGEEVIDENVLENGVMICTYNSSKYATTISSESTFTDGAITTNVLKLEGGVVEETAEEDSERSNLIEKLEIFNNLSLNAQDEAVSIENGVTTISLNSTNIETLKLNEENLEFSNHFQNYQDLKEFYEGLEFICETTRN